MAVGPVTPVQGELGDAAAVAGTTGSSGSPADWSPGRLLPVHQHEFEF